MDNLSVYRLNMFEEKLKSVKILLDIYHQPFRLGTTVTTMIFYCF